MSEQYDADNTYDRAMAAGNETMQAASDQAVNNFDKVVESGKSTVEDYSESAATTGRGAETLNKEMMAYSKQSFEDAITATKAIMSSKSAYEALQIQADFTKAAAEAYFSQMSKISRIFAEITKDAVAPFHRRAESVPRKDSGQT